MKRHCPEILVHEFMQAFHNILLSSPLCFPSLSLPLPLYLPYLSLSLFPSPLSFPHKDHRSIAVCLFDVTVVNHVTLGEE